MFFSTHGFLVAGTPLPFSSLGLKELQILQLWHANTHTPTLLRHTRHLVPEGIVVQDELADTLDGLCVDALGCQQHVEQLEQGDDGMELDSLRSQPLYGALLSVHYYYGIRHLQQIKIAIKDNYTDWGQVKDDSCGNMNTVLDGLLYPKLNACMLDYHS